MNKLDKNGRVGQILSSSWTKTMNKSDKKLSTSRIKPMNKSDKNCDQVGQNM